MAKNHSWPLNDDDSSVRDHDSDSYEDFSFVFVHKTKEDTVVAKKACSWKLSVLGNPPTGMGKNWKMTNVKAQDDA